jgi:hypothetical protein
MKKAAFYLLLIIAVIFLYKVLRILLVDFTRLTDYGFGYLTGQVILLIAASFLAYRLRRHR